MLVWTVPSQSTPSLSMCGALLGEGGRDGGGGKERGEEGDGGQRGEEKEGMEEGGVQ